ncbi:MAG TPA: nucleoside diphosphate kinase regulator [Hyphomicrobium sp.]|nr:nucleoside diphosphate kinase regulator [Hyphomicrobium sp.]
MTHTDTITATKPEIVISTQDHARLSRLAEGLVDRLPEVAGELLTEVERARVVPSESMTADIVAMGSTVAYETETGEQREVTLVYPDEADIAKGRISILTPIGVALIGLRAGQSMNWVTRDGRKRILNVIRVGES